VKESKKVKISAFYILIALTIYSNLGHADDLKLTNGRVLKNYRIINHSPKDVMIIYDGGAETVLLKNLPEELREKYGYNKEKMEAYEKQKSIEDAAYRRKQEIIKEQWKLEVEEKRRLKELREQAKAIRFKVKSVHEDGLLVIHRKWETREVPDTRTMGVSYGDGVMRTRQELYMKKVTVEVPSDEVSFVVNYPMDEVVDSQLIYGYFTRIGTYDYITVTGSKKTVKKYIYFPN